LEDQYNNTISAASSLPMAQTRAFENWHQKRASCLYRAKLHQDIIHDIVQGSDYRLRGGVVPLFTFMHLHRVPMLLLTCGLADFSRDLLTSASLLTEHLHFAGNFFMFAPNGLASAFSSPVIHPLNKREEKLGSATWFSVAGGRQNVVVIGDHKWDSTVTAEEGSVILKVGIVSTPDSVLRHDRTQKMLEYYDIVLQGEDSMIDLLSLWKLILGAPAGFSF
jgi:hypothetical protein